MKIIGCIFVSILVAACAAPPPPATLAPSPAAVSSPAATAGAVRTLVVAHRGGSALAPENTLGAFGNAIQLGVDMVECDVHLSKDGEVVVMHDPSVATTTDGSGQIGTLTLAEIKKLNAAAKSSLKEWSPQAVPTLAEVLDLAKGKVGIQIEIKLTAGNARYPSIERKVLDLINARDMLGQVILISFDFPTLQEVKKLEPRAKTGALVRADWFTGRDAAKAVGDAIAATGADYFMPTSAPVTEAHVQAAHASGIKIGVWTVNTTGEMQRYARYGVDAITSDKPDELKQVLGR